MGLLDIKTAIVIGGFSGWENQKRAVNVFSPEEIDELDSGMLSGMDRERLAALRKKMSDTYDELYADCDPGTLEWKTLERRTDKLDDLMDRIDEILEPEYDCLEDEEDS